MGKSVLRVAAKAVILSTEGKVLILREAAYKDGTNTGKYHVPGGRLEAGEAFKDALTREILEETGLENVEVRYPIHVDEWRPVIHGQETQIVGIFMFCKTTVTDVALSHEHDESIWINPSKYAEYDLLPAEAAAIRALLNRPASLELA